MADGVTMDDVLAECRRIGFGMEELGGLAITDGATLADFRDFLRSIPDGAGYDECLRRSRDGREPTDEELREHVGPELRARVRALLREPEFTGTTWSERARWLRLAADEIERQPLSAQQADSVRRCSFCERPEPEAGSLVGSNTGAHICGQCADLAREVLSDEQAI